MNASAHWYRLLIYMAAVGCAYGQMPNKFTAHINSPRDERAPLISPDGKTLYFTIANHPNNLGGKKDEGDIWISTWSGDTWSAPVHGGQTLNNMGYNTVEGISEDGRTLYLFGNYDRGGNTKNCHIAVSKRTLATWSIPKLMDIPYFPTRSTTLSGYILPNKRVLIFAGMAYDTQGAEDIYVCTKDPSGKWKEPRNVGEHINTPYQEFSPWLSDDMQYLYFASNGHPGGYGSFDIYRSKRMDDSWTIWSTPENMGKDINSSGRELFYREYPKQGIALYTTTQNSDGYGDIRAVLSKTHYPTQDTIESTPKMTTIDSTESTSITIRGHITEKNTDKPIAASIRFDDSLHIEATTTPYGLFSIDTPVRDTYHVHISASGYMSRTKTLHPPTSGVWEVDFALDPVRVGVTINLENVFFTRGTPDLLTVSFGQLNRVVELMQNNPAVAIMLAGYTDNKGSFKHNLRLSQERVKAVKSYLVNKGIAENRISGKGFGGMKPIASNATESTRKLNRRVEFTIIKD